jgi:hypothetical protein
MRKERSVFMNQHIDRRHLAHSVSSGALRSGASRPAAVVGGLALALAACNARLAVLDDPIDAGGAGRGGGTDGGLGGLAPEGDAGEGDATASCQDALQNGDEADVDCGGSQCAACGSARHCEDHTDCVSGNCQAGLCQNGSCTDAVRNGDETGIDCGGSACSACPGTACSCARSPSLVALGCEGAEAGSDRFDGVTPKMSDGGGAVAFDWCDARGCRPSLWTEEAGTVALLPSPPSGSTVVGITGDGQQVLLSPPLGLGAEALSYSANGIATATGLRPSPVLLSAEGSVVGVTVSALGSSNLMRWSQAAGLEMLGVLPFDANQIVLHATTPAASLIVGAADSGSGPQPFRWTEAGGLVLGLDELPSAANGATITAVSRDGSSFAGVLHDGANAIGVFHWSEVGGLVELGRTQSLFGSRVMLSDDGAVVAGTLEGGQMSPAAVRWNQASGAVPLTPSILSAALDMSGDGSIIIGQPQDYSADPVSNPPLFVWSTQQGARDLRTALEASGVDFAGWELYGSAWLSRDGRFATGYGSCAGRNTVFRVAVPQ